MTGTTYLANRIKRALEKNGIELKYDSFHTILAVLEDLPPQCLVHIQRNQTNNGKHRLSWLSLKAFINTLPLNEKIDRHKFYQYFKNISIKQDKKENAKFRQYISTIKSWGFIETSHNYIIVRKYVPIDLSSTRYWGEYKQQLQNQNNEQTRVN